MTCSCGGAPAVVITGGDGLSVTGSGTVSDPYVISGDVELNMVGADSTTIDMTVVGSGTVSDPFVISAEATVSVNDLTDVSDSTPPVTDDVLKFDGTNWVYGPVPVSPGAVNTGGGISGDGSGGAPISVDVSNTVVDATSGLYTYIDSNGELRAEVRGTAWADVSGKPTTFAPAPHTHPNSDLTQMLSGTTAPTAGIGTDGAWYAQYV